MFVSTPSITYCGLDVSGVDVEVSIESRGLPCFDIVGLPAKSVAESKHRIKMSFSNLKLDFPSRKRIVVNLAPADIQKEGSFYDLPIATSILCAQYNLEMPEKSLFFGEISLDGHLRHVGGAFLLSSYAKDNGYKQVFVPQECVEEARSVSGLSVFGVNNLLDLRYHLAGISDIKSVASGNNFEYVQSSSDAFACIYDQILGQDNAKRALEICAAGRHNMILSGPPGSGKSMLAKSLKYIMPPLSESESIEITKIYSAVGKIPPNKSLISERPFRSPHHTVSYAGLVGGGSMPSPGEITLAHNGVLFLDEINEFPRSVIESLRQPLEDREITVVRTKRSFKFPANFTLIAACNPCPCGFLGHPTKMCECSERQIVRYRNRLSGPFLDRIDLHVSVFPIESSLLEKYVATKNPVEISSKKVKERVFSASLIQEKRFSSTLRKNSMMTNSEVKKFCTLDRKSNQLMEKAYNSFNLSARTYFRILKVARTIADLDNAAIITDNHVSEALQYRVKLG